MKLETKVQLINELFQNGFDIEIILKLKEALEEELRIDLLGSKKKIDLYKFAKKFTSDKCITREDFKGLIQESNKYYLCNGYMVIEFLEPIEGMQITNSDMKLSSVFPNIGLYTEYIDDEILVKCKRTLKGSPCIITHNNVRHGFNPTYLENALKCINKPQIFLSGNPCDPMLVIGDNDVRAMILPVRLPKEDNDADSE